MYSKKEVYPSKFCHASDIAIAKGRAIQEEEVFFVIVLV